MAFLAEGCLEIDHPPARSVEPGSGWRRMQYREDHVLVGRVVDLALSRPEEIMEATIRETLVVPFDGMKGKIQTPHDRADWHSLQRRQDGYCLLAVVEGTGLDPVGKSAGRNGARNLPNNAHFMVVSDHRLVNPYIRLSFVPIQDAPIRAEDAM